MPESARLKLEYWRRTRRITLGLLLLWGLATVACCLYANELNQVVVMGFPLGFYMAAQGLLLWFLAIVGFYALYMDRLEASLRKRSELRPQGGTV